MKEEIHKIHFNSVKDCLPEKIPIADDNRWFIFVSNGDPRTGFYVVDAFFKTVDNVIYEAEAWAECEEALRVNPKG